MDEIVGRRDCPGLSELISVSEALTNAGVVHVLGGTGLLFGLGFDVEPQDWDILTEAPVEHIKLALDGWPMRVAGAAEFFPSDYLIQIPLSASRIEIIGNFAIATPERVFRIPVRISGRFRGVPLAHPADWILAYRAMELLPVKNLRGDGSKARMLERVLAKKKKTLSPMKIPIDPPHIGQCERGLHDHHPDGHS